MRRALELKSKDGTQHRPAMRTVMEAGAHKCGTANVHHPAIAANNACELSPAVLPRRPSHEGRGLK